MIKNTPTHPHNGGLVYLIRNIPVAHKRTLPTIDCVFMLFREG